MSNLNQKMGNEKLEYKKPELSVDGDEALFSPIAIAGVYLYVGMVTVAAAELVVAVHAGLFLWPKS